MKEKKEYNVSMLLTSHNMAEVEEMCDRVTIIQSGKIIDQDTPENLAKKITKCFLHLLIAQKTEQAKIFFDTYTLAYTQSHHTFTVSLEEKDIALFLISLAKEHIIYDEITIDKPSLEDYFLKVVKEKI